MFGKLEHYQMTPPYPSICAVKDGRDLVLSLGREYFRWTPPQVPETFRWHSPRASKIAIAILRFLLARPRFCTCEDYDYESSFVCWEIGTLSLSRKSGREHGVYWTAFSRHLYVSHYPDEEYPGGQIALHFRPQDL